MTATDVATPDRQRTLVIGGEVWSGKEFNRVDLEIQAGRIAGIGRFSSTSGDVLISAEGMLVVPGFSNGHTHTHNVFARGYLDVGCLEMLMNIQPAAAENRSADDTYWAASLNALANLKAGTTAVCDQFVCLPHISLEHVSAVVQAYVDLGLRATVSPLVADRSFWPLIRPYLGDLPLVLEDFMHARAAKQVNLNNVEQCVKEWQSVSERVSVAVSPLIPVLCSDRLLEGCASIAELYGTNVYMHTAESFVQSTISRDVYGRSIIEHLASIGMLSDRSVLAHGVWLSDRDLDLIADANAIVVHNPTSNMRLGSGIAPVREMLRRGVRVALGTDGVACSDHQSIFEAMRMAAVVSRVRSTDQSEWLTCSEAFAMGAETGYDALEPGGAGQNGRIAVGRRADLVLISRSTPWLHPDNDRITQLVLAGSEAAVDTVLVGGEVVFARGRALRVDEERIYARVDEAALRLRARNRVEWENATRLAPFIARGSMRMSPSSISAVPHASGRSPLTLPGVDA